MEHFLNLPPDGAAHGQSIDHLIGLVHWLMALLFVGWGTFYILTLVRFRRSRNPKANYTGVKSHASTYLEAGVLIIEVILLVAFSIPIWSKRVDAFPLEKDATVVRVVAEQFSWNVHYPGPDGKFGKTAITLVDADNPLGLDRSDADAKDDITTINQLNLPVGKPVIVYLSSKDVIHSFGIPPYRVKQDAVPGMSIPVWFTPIKTTDAIREELRQSYPISEVLKKVSRMALPGMSTMTIRKGMSMGDMMAMQDYNDQSGATLVSKGDKLTGENIDKLADAGITSVSARTAAGLDKYVIMDEVKDNAGNPIVAKNEPLTEDVVSKLVEAGMKETQARKVSNMDAFVVMQEYTDKSGAAIAAKGDAVSEELLSKFAEAGISDVVIAPATPTEIACAQLCGLGHYRMRGYVSVQEPAQFKEWYDQQEAALAPPQSAPDSTTAPSSGAPDSTATTTGSNH